MITLSEIAWKKPFKYYVNNLYIPITNNISNILNNDIRINTFHVTEPSTYNNLKEIILSKKSISTFTKTTNNVTDGIKTKGGILIYLEGKLLLESINDIYSQPDENGLRWINSADFLGLKLSDQWKLIMYDYLQNENRNHNIYFKLAEKYINDNKEEIIKTLNLKKFSGSIGWNEILVNHITIIDTFIDVDYISGNIINHFSHKLRFNKKYKTKSKFFDIYTKAPEKLSEYIEHDLVKKFAPLTKRHIITSNEMDREQFFVDRGGQLTW